jgi:hypothetical protein
MSRGESPEAIARSYRTLHLADGHAVISRYLLDPAPFDEYLRRCDDEAEAVRRKLDAARLIQGRTGLRRGRRPWAGLTEGQSPVDSVSPRIVGAG